MKETSAKQLETKLLFSVGEKVQAFDSADWHAHGGDTATNEEFWKPAVVTCARISNQGPLYDVLYDHRPQRESCGHFESALRKSVGQIKQKKSKPQAV